MNYYPEDGKSLYYVEFGRGVDKNEFTLFRRQYLYPQEEWEKMEHGPLEFNEVHPWNIMTARFGPDGRVPDRAWVKFMVEALNYYAAILR